MNPFSTIVNVTFLNTFAINTYKVFVTLLFKRKFIQIIIKKCINIHIVTITCVNAIYSIKFYVLLIRIIFK